MFIDHCHWKQYSSLRIDFIFKYYLSIITHSSLINGEGYCKIGIVSEIVSYIRDHYFFFIYFSRNEYAWAWFFQSLDKVYPNIESNIYYYIKNSMSNVNWKINDSGTRSKDCNHCDAQCIILSLVNNVRKREGKEKKNW